MVPLFLCSKQKINEPRFNQQGYFGELGTRTVENPLYTDPNLKKKREGLPAYDELENEYNKDIY